MQSKLLVGYFPGWSQCSSGRNSVLIYGEDLAAIAELQNLFIELAKGEVSKVQLHTLNFIESVGNIKVVARVSDVDEGMRKLENADSFEWKTTSKYWIHFAEELSVFRNLEPDRGSHQYLDTSVIDDADVEVSFNEYSIEWFRQAHAAYNS